MPALDERFGVDQRGRRFIAHAIWAVAVLQAFACDDAQARDVCSFEHRVDRSHMRGSESERGGDAVAQQFRYKKRSALRSIFVGCVPFFFWEGVVFKPGEQAIGWRADHIHLWVMHMHVHKAGRDDAAGPMLGGHIMIGLAQRSSITRRADLALVVHHQQAIGIEDGCAAFGKAQQAGPVSASGLRMDGVHALILLSFPPRQIRARSY
jgi:hypothetical protein